MHLNTAFISDRNSTQRLYKDIQCCLLFCDIALVCVTFFLLCIVLFFVLVLYCVLLVMYVLPPFDCIGRSKSLCAPDYYNTESYN
jgi:type IV secretory pathway TrbL component